MAFTLHDISASLPPEKNRADGLWTRFVLRPLSIPVAWAALRLHFGANGVSYISSLFSIAGGVLFSMNGFWLPLWGAILFNCFSVLDCVDGNIARVTHTASPWGGWADAVMGFVAYTCVFISTGIYVYLRGGCWLVLVIAAVTASANLLTRVAYQIYKNIVGEEAHGSVSFERKLAENVGITGFLMPALIVCHFTGGMIFIVAFNLLFYLGGCLATIIKLARKISIQSANK
ncbi:CDP-alcohol phosphatidyltransferase family protein [Leadbettera azotonutricia]|uniref:CDP-alcohol phosphatidyltransferase family n=1 Tax=Leadbettera azotonutricia (strain ATCC BAA-888 / DSM 13862 / ZAS-9) TaxID=545695 RepID=F5YAT9_LEAAZ|nr:CDP-alcohol phosphatidyltransferase family protein [Leadbettera azotonutricia]AEF81443.1 CDP-alcohol phosphatidyltransferase family [Leadbettera azotonutricia ZAS-9]